MDEIIEEEVVESEETEEVVEEEVKEESEEKPAFLMGEEDKPDSVPLASFLKTKGKLKGQIENGRAENEELKARIKTLEEGSIPTGTHTLELPFENDFETDDEYREARKAYETQLRASILAETKQTNTQQTQQERIQQEIGNNVNSHYTRAEALIKQHSIDPDVYKTADNNVRQAVEAVLPNQGDQSVDYLISLMGDDSEKVLFYLGRNKTKLAEFQSSIVNDPSGHKAAMMLGRLEKEIKTTKKTSRAPKPTVNVKGDTVTPAKSKATKKRFDAAVKEDNWQEAFNIKQDAKVAGEDTKDWS